MDNKVRKSFKGYPKRVKVGYRGPHEVRGYHSSGHTEVLVHNPHDLMKVVPEKDVVRIGRTVGAKEAGGDPEEGLRAGTQGPESHRG